MCVNKTILSYGWKAVNKFEKVIGTIPLLDMVGKIYYCKISKLTNPKLTYSETIQKETEITAINYCYISATLRLPQTACYIIRNHFF